MSHQAMDTHLMCSSKSRLDMHHRLRIGDRRGKAKSEYGKKITERRVLTGSRGSGLSGYRKWVSEGHSSFCIAELVGTWKEDDRTTQGKRKRKEWVSWLGG